MCGQPCPGDHGTLLYTRHWRLAPLALDTAGPLAPTGLALTHWHCHQLTQAHPVSPSIINQLTAVCISPGSRVTRPLPYVIYTPPNNCSAAAEQPGSAAGNSVMFCGELCGVLRRTVWYSSENCVVFCEEVCGVLQGLCGAVE